MKEVVFLSLDEILEIHQDQLGRYGGTSGIRDLELLKSAVAMPPLSLSGEYVHADIFQMAAAYLFHLVRNHPFIDGNKRTGAVAAIVFLIINGTEINAGEDALEKRVISAAEGKSDKAAIVRFFSKHAAAI